MKEQDFWDQLKDKPKDTTTKLVFADWCEDHKRSFIAFALRWCVKYNRWPRRDKKKESFIWYCLGDFPKRTNNSVPIIVFYVMLGLTREEDEDYVSYSTLDGAMRGLADVLDQMRADLGVK